MKSASLTGFLLPNFNTHFPEYLKKLIELVLSKKIKIILDFGKSETEGEFIGIESVVRGVEVCAHQRIIRK